MDRFVHLHVHTDYSMLDGAARLPALFAEAARLGQPALAMTDHGNMHGAYDFYHEALKHNVKPIIGMEAYVTPGTHRGDRTAVRWGDGGRNDVGGNGAYTHVTLLAQDAQGLRNLFRLSSLASLEGQYYKPRVDRELLAQYSQGVIATTGCMGGEVQTRLRLGQPEAAYEAASAMKDIFGDHYYLEVMDHEIEDERACRPALVALGRKLGLPVVATNDAHYVLPADKPLHDAVCALGSGSTLAEPKFKFDGQGYWLKSSAEMRSYWDTELPGACDTTLLIADRVGDYSPVFEPRNLMPRADVPEGDDEDSWLRLQAQKGLMQRPVPGGVAYNDRLSLELDVIRRKGFSGYFLVVAEICAEMKRRGILYNTRGSGAGSLVAYALGITRIDPVPNGILFERMLNPERPSAPDFDLDIDESRRDEMIAWCTERYGADRVAQIATFGIIKSRAAIKDANRVLGNEYIVGERLTQALPPVVMGKDVPLRSVMTDSKRREAVAFRNLVDMEDWTKPIVDLALQLEGLKRSVGKHAAGVILSSEPLMDVLPVFQSEGSIVTAWEMNACDAMGLLKMDFLGLRNLSVVSRCLEHLGKPLEWLETLPQDDPKVYAMLAEGRTQGVFQLDSPGMTGLVKLARPKSVLDISAVLALYRPGPMGVKAHLSFAHRANGEEEVTPIHPELAEPLADILGETYGLIVYQEQVMLIAQRLAGYSLGKADLLRRAMGKKKAEVLAAEYEPFAAGMRANGYSDDAVNTLWEILVPFSDYAFNKAHTASYGQVSYWTAYLKANHPAEYMAALLTSVGDDHERLAGYLEECRALRVEVLPPCVNESGLYFTPVGPRSIRFGLMAIRNVGQGVAQAIVDSRPEAWGGRYLSFHHWLKYVPSHVLNKKTVDSLIKAGAFDGTGDTRMGLHEAYEGAIDAILPGKRLEESGQHTLFEELRSKAPPRALPPLGGLEWDRSELEAHETEMLGLCVSTLPSLSTLSIDVPADRATVGRLQALRDGLEQAPGHADVHLVLTAGERRTEVHWPMLVDPEAAAFWIRLAGFSLSA